MLCVLAPLVLLIPGITLAGPPETPSGLMVQDDVPQLRAEVRRLEKEVAHDKSSLVTADDLSAARARLATAEGRRVAACAEWQKVIAGRQERVAHWEKLVAKGLDCSPVEGTFLRGAVAEARCGLAEAQKDMAVLVRELPGVVAYREAQLRLFDELRKRGAYEPQETQEEREARRALRQARSRLDGVIPGPKPAEHSR
jgi:hypothetical protein